MGCAAMLKDEKTTSKQSGLTSCLQLASYPRMCFIILIAINEFVNVCDY